MSPGQAAAIAARSPASTFAADVAASPVAFIVFLLVVLVGLPLLFCADAKRKMAPAFGIGEHVLVRRGGNRLNKKHLAQITAVPRERRPVLLTGGLYADEIVQEADLPLKLAGISHCFRTEAGAAGRESKGRVGLFALADVRDELDVVHAFPPGFL